MNESGTRQGALSICSQKRSTAVELVNPLVPKNSDELVVVLKGFHGSPCKWFSLDVKDLYYSLNQSNLLLSARKWLEENL